MKVLGIISTATLFLLLGTAVPVLAQGDHQEEAKPQKQEQGKPEKQQQEAKPQQHQEQAKPMQQQQSQQAKPQREQKAKSQQQNRSNDQQRSQQARATTYQDQQEARSQQQSRSNDQQHSQQAANRQEQQPRQHAQRSAADEQRQRSQPELRLSARGEGRIPDDRFRSNFGRRHEFRIGSPRLVDGYSRFQYGGYWFGFVQPWPVEWYYTDDVYVDYINGQYYLCNPSYPGDQIAISVVL
jgi:hypothetical protein